MSTEGTGSLIKFAFIQLWLAIILLAGWVEQAQGQRLTMDTVYSSVDLSNRVMDVLLRKSKGIDKVAKVKLQEQALTTAHVYQLQVSTLELVRQLEKTFTMVPCPLVVNPPEKVQVGDAYSLSMMMLAEVRRLAIQLNIWGLPEERHTFKGKSASAVFALSSQVYQKLRLLGELPSPGAQELAGQFDRAVTDMEQVLGSIDLAKRYKVQAQGLEVAKLKDLGRPVMALRQELNRASKAYKLQQTRPGKVSGAMSGLELFLQSQIILADVGRLKVAVGCPALSPINRKAKGAGVKAAADKLAKLTLLVSQVETLKSLQ